MLDNDYPFARYPHAAAWATQFDAISVPELFARSAAEFGHRPYLDFLGKVQSYAAVSRQIDRAAKGFQLLGVGKGVRVGLFLPNCPHYVIAYYGILKAGGTVVNFSPLYSVSELAHQVEDSQTEFMVCLDVASLFATISKVLDTTALKALIVGSLADALPLGKSLLYRMFKQREQAKYVRNDTHVSFADLLSNDGMPTPVEINPLTDIAVLQYTGGTTGTPKGAMLSHANLSVNAQQVASIDARVVRGQEIMFGGLPFFHVFANTVVLNATTVMGGMIAMLPRFELVQALKMITRTRPTILPGVPTMFTALLDHPQLAKYDLTSLRTCISGGAALPVELKYRFEAASGASISEGYGLTETSGVVSVNPFVGLNKPGSIGVCLPGCQIIISDRDDPHKLLPNGEVGEICIVGPQVMLGYWGQPQSTAEVLVDGRLRTGDVGYLDADGYGFVIDRIKDMITVGGFKVFPRRIEEALYTHPAVKEAVVIGIADPYSGERPKAFVVMNAGLESPPNPDALLAFLKPLVGKHEYPVALEIRDSLPKSMIGKLSKKDLIAEEAQRAAQKA